jgi:hypothetical protein
MDREETFFSFVLIIRNLLKKCNESAIKSIENFWKFRKKRYLCIRNRETAN